MWEAVAKTDWAMDMEPRPLSAAVIYQRVQEYGIETKTKPARGRKRTNTLELTNDIEGVETKPAPVAISFVNDRMNKFNAGIPLRPGCSMIVVPAGACPHKLSGTDENSVTDWGKKIVKTFFTQRQQLAPSALAYFAREFYDVFSEEFKTVEKNIAACKAEIYSHSYEE